MAFVITPTALPLLRSPFLSSFSNRPLCFRPSLPRPSRQAHHTPRATFNEQLQWPTTETTLSLHASILLTFISLAIPFLCAMAQSTPDLLSWWTVLNTKYMTHLEMWALLVSFAVVHSGLAAARNTIVKITGERLYRILFACASLPMAGVCIAFFIAHRYDGLVLWNMRGEFWARGFVGVLSALSFGLLYPGTFDLLAIAAIRKPVLNMFEDVGVMRITRHPQLWGQILWCTGHQLWLGSSFGMVASLGLIAHHLFGAWHGDRRLEEKYGQEWKEYAKRTSIVPFAAVLDGRQTIRLQEFLSPAYIGVTIFVAVLYKAHPLMLSVVGSGLF